MDQITAALTRLQEALPFASSPWAVPVGAGLIAVFLFSLATRGGRATWAAVLGMVLTLLLPLILLGGGALVALAQVVTFDPIVWASLIAAVVVALALIAYQIARTRRRDEERRALLRIFHADIAQIVGADGPDDLLSEYGRQMVEIMQANPGFVPVIPTEATTPLIDRFAGRLTDLSPNVAAAIASYYAQSDRLARFAADMQLDAFYELSSERQVNMYRDYIAMKSARLTYGETALTQIERLVKADRGDAARNARAGL